MSEQIVSNSVCHTFDTGQRRNTGIDTTPALDSAGFLWLCHRRSGADAHLLVHVDKELYKVIHGVQLHELNFGKPNWKIHFELPVDALHLADFTRQVLAVGPAVAGDERFQLTTVDDKHRSLESALKIHELSNNRSLAAVPQHTVVQVVDFLGFDSDFTDDVVCGRKALDL